MLSISVQYDPRYLTKEVAAGAENYYLRAVGDGVRGEPAGIWTGRACANLGLEGEVNNEVFERLVDGFWDPRDPQFLDQSVPDTQKARLGRPARNYTTPAELFDAAVAAEPDASAERRKQLWIEAKKKGRNGSVKGKDLTFSPPKSVTLLHASLQAKAHAALQRGDVEVSQVWARRAELVWEAVMAGNQAILDDMQAHAGQGRSGYFGKKAGDRTTGRYVDANEWIIASFRQHTNRNEDPQLHVHNFVLWRADLGDDEEKWRTLDAYAINRRRAASAAIGERTMFERLAATLGVDVRKRFDGNGLEIDGVEQALIDAHSSRRAEVTEAMRELVAAYEAQHGRSPSAQALFRMGQFVTKDSKAPKPKLSQAPTRAELLAMWEDHTRATTLQSLSDLPDQTLGKVSPAQLAERAYDGYDVDQVLEAALAEVQAKRAVWGRSQLIQAINNQLPETLGGLDTAHVTTVLDELADTALDPRRGYVRLLNAPEVVATPASLQRADGTSVYEPREAQRYTTGEHLDREGGVLSAARETGARRLSAIRAATLLGLRLPETPGPEQTAPKQNFEAAGEQEISTSSDGGGSAEPSVGTEHGVEHSGSGVTDPARGVEPLDAGADDSAGRAPALGLRPDQADAVFGILTDGRRISVLSAAAGAGKSYTMSAVDKLWRQQTAGRTIGLTTSQNAAFVLNGEGLSEANNIRQFLTQYARGKVQVDSNDLLIIDETSMVSTSDLAKVHHIADRAGAKLLLTGDPEQLSAPEAGGLMRQLVEDVGAYELTEVTRFAEEWERDASIRLREGDTSVLADYDRRGRLREGTREQMETAAYEAWLADYLTGRDTLLIAPRADQATALSGRAHARLAELGHVEADGVELHDHNHAGVGDLIQTRRNDQKLTDGTGRWVANRDVYKILDRTEAGDLRVARVNGSSVQHGRSLWLPGAYVRSHVELGYAGTVHAAQGRTVDTCHSLIDPTVTRELAYVALTRARQKNMAYTVTDPVGLVDMATTAKPAPQLDPDQQQPEEDAPDRYDVLTQIFDRADAEPTATETIRAEQDRATHLAHLGPQWIDQTREQRGALYEGIIADLLSSGELDKWRADRDTLGPLSALLREAEELGMDPQDTLRGAITERPLSGDDASTDAHSLGAVLHWRVEQRVDARREHLANHPDEAARIEQATPQTWAERTPADLPDPERQRFVRELAEQMDARTDQLGERIAAAPPTWALRHLGPVPDDPLEAATWTRRAGIVAGFAEQFTPDEQIDTDPLGHRPGNYTPEARAAWRQAYRALGLDPAKEEIRGQRAGDLGYERAAFERLARWAPAYVGDELREAHQALADYETQAALLAAQARTADTETERDGLVAQAQRQARLAEATGQKVAALSEVNTARERWVAATASDRARAEEIGAELRRRAAQHSETWERTGAELPALDETPGERAEREHIAAQRTERDQVIDGQLELPIAAGGPTLSGQEKLALHTQSTQMRETLRRRLNGWLRRDRSEELNAEQIRHAVEEAQQRADHHRAAAEPAPEPNESAQHTEVAPGQTELDLGLADDVTDVDLRDAVAQAREAQRLLTQREHQHQRAQQTADREEAHTARRVRERQATEAHQRQQERERRAEPTPAQRAGRDDPDRRLPPEAQRLLDANRTAGTRRSPRQDTPPRPPRRDQPHRGGSGRSL